VAVTSPDAPSQDPAAAAALPTTLLPDACRSPAPKVQTSPGSSHTEGANFESSCSASSALGPAFRGPQRLGLCACLAASKFRHSIWVFPSGVWGTRVHGRELHQVPLKWECTGLTLIFVGNTPQGVVPLVMYFAFAVPNHVESIL